MTKFVYHNARFEITIPVWHCRIPQIHAHAPVLPVGWRHKVRVVEPRPILRVRNDSVVLEPAAPKVILLEVAGDFVEAVSGIAPYY